MNARVQMSPSLTDLANRHGSDKGTVGLGRGWSGHNYTDIYDAYMHSMRGDAISLLEIGLGVDGPRWRSLMQQGRNVEGGASLKMWQDYFQRGTVHGIDINPAGHLDGERSKTFVADQGEVAELEQFVAQCDPGCFDIIIDDGSHNPRHQQVSLGFFFQLLRPGGLYIIEDLADNGLGDIARGGPGSESVLNTRRVLRHFVETGAFGKPNALVDPEYVGKYAEFIRFHAPVPKVRYQMRPPRSGRRRPVVSVLRYKVGTERLCVLRKKV